LEKYAMAKMFYTTDEAALKLGKTEAQLKEMVARGELQEFRDRDRLMFKKEQVDLIASGDDFIPLAESGEHDAIGLASSGTNLGKDAKEGTGIALFDPDATEEGDANAVTRVTASPLSSFKDPGSSGSGSRAGLMDMTKEADDTSLGAGLLEDVYGGETMSQTAADVPSGGGMGGGEFGGGAGLFESPGTEVGEVAGAGVGMTMAFAEPYDGPGSGWVGGLAFGTVLITGLAVFTAIVGMAGGTGTGMLSNLVSTLGENIYIILGAGAGACLLFAGVGYVMGKKS
jgi:hypothetical protein